MKCVITLSSVSAIEVLVKSSHKVIRLGFKVKCEEEFFYFEEILFNINCDT